MIITAKPKKFKLYVNTKKKTAAQVKTETGANIVINCWLYTMSTFTANCDVKVDGKVLSDDQYKYWGYGFNKNDTRMTMSNDMSAWENYFSCVTMIKDGQKQKMNYDSAIGGSRPRSAVGFKADGSVVVYCTHSNTSIPQVQAEMLKQGCVDAINLDGGGSVQIASDYGNLTSSRRVHGYLCIWTEGKVLEKCPYNEPTIDLKPGVSGTGVKWLQWHLNKIMSAGLTVGGFFGNATKNSLIKFQRSNGLTANGICNKPTRDALKSKYNK